MEIQENYDIRKLLDEKTFDKLVSLAESIDSLYEMDRTWNKGFGEWCIITIQRPVVKNRKTPLT